MALCAEISRTETSMMVSHSDEDRFLPELKRLSKTMKQIMEPENWYVQLMIRIKVLLSRLDFNGPMGRMIHLISIKFGTSVLGYYNLAKLVFRLNLFLFIFWFALIILPWFKYWSGRDWKDETGRNVIDEQELILNFFGANPSNRSTDKTWFFYSGYPPKFDNYEMGSIYVLCALGTYAVSLVLVVGGIGSAIQSSTSNNATDSFSLPCSLYAMDWGVVDPQSVDEKLLGSWMSVQADYYSSIRNADFFVGQKVRCLEDESTKWKAGTITNLEGTTYTISLTSDSSLVYITNEEKLEPDLKCGLRPRTIRRIIGGTLSFLLCCASFVGLYFSVFYREDMDRSFPLTSSIVVKTVNIIIPKVQSAIVSLENIRNSAEIVKQEVARVFVIKMAGIIFMYMSVREMEKSASAGDACPEFLVGAMFEQLLVTDAIVDVFITIAAAVYAKKSKADRTEFKVSTEIINTLYKQGLTWIGTLYCPMLPLVSAVCTGVVFFVKAKCMLLVCKPPSQPVSSEGASATYRALLLIALLVATVPLFSFVNTKKEHCGPHVESLTCQVTGTCETPIESLNVYVKTTGLTAATNWIFSAVVLFVAVICCLIVIYLLMMSLIALRIRSSKQAEDLDCELKDFKEQFKAIAQPNADSPSRCGIVDNDPKYNILIKRILPTISDETAKAIRPFISMSILSDAERQMKSDAIKIEEGNLPGSCRPL